ncbi:MAG: hypothetical protein K2J61_01780 [Clostridia bacterium]|nr:hypothetical protein [Clostridia bacterium]
MKTKIRNYLFTAIAAILLVIANLFPVGIVRLFADSKDAQRFGATVNLYSTNTSTETIEYGTRTDDMYETTNGVPEYTGQLSNSCGATAGATIIGFYDKYYEDLIPDYTSYYSANGEYRIQDKVYIPTLMEELYGLMKITSTGVSENNCLSGLRQYVQNHSHLISFGSVKSSSKINETTYLNAINANKPVIIFAKSVEIVQDIVYGTNYDTVIKMDISSNHVFVGYGYYRVKYYNNGKVFRTDTYLKVATGLTGIETSFIRVSSTEVSVSQSWLVNAYSVTIT